LKPTAAALRSTSGFTSLVNAYINGLFSLHQPFSSLSLRDTQDSLLSSWDENKGLSYSKTEEQFIGSSSKLSLTDEDTSTISMMSELLMYLLIFSQVSNPSIIGMFMSRRITSKWLRGRAITLSRASSPLLAD
jgi:hypothetical protein